nr:hypothetical protein [Tanacetum cinerariifolium]
MGNKNSIRPCTLGDHSRPSHNGYQNAIELPEGAKVSPRDSTPSDSIELNDATRNTTRLHLFCFSFHDQAINWLDRLLAGSISTWDDLTTQSGALLKDLAIYDNESWNDPKDFAKPIKEISLPQDVPSTSDRRLIELEYQYCMENHEQAFVDYASSHTDEAGEQNRNRSSLKRVYFINSIIILNKENEAKESTKSSAAEYKDNEMSVESEEEFEEETKEETKEEEEDNPKHLTFSPL